jgi:hypothetical protein
MQDGDNEEHLGTASRARPQIRQDSHGAGPTCVAADEPRVNGILMCAGARRFAPLVALKGSVSLAGCKHARNCFNGQHL